MNTAKKLSNPSQAEAKVHILESFDKGIPLNIISPKVDGHLFFVYKDAWKEILSEAKESGDQERLLSLLEFGASSGVSKAYGKPAA